jgi:hypothetical protein
MAQKDLENNKDDSLIEEEPIFEVHKMPKGYKIGRFENGNGNGLSDKKMAGGEANNKPHKSNKKIGVIIISLGVIIVLFLGYLIFSYINNPNFSLSGIFGFSDKKNQADSKLGYSSSSGIPLEELIREPLEEKIDSDTLESETSEEDLILEEEDLEEELILEEELSYSFLDSDSDGLSDDEEILLGTDFSSPDSDKDGYGDLTEILNLYNPAGDGRLSANKNISKYQNNIYDYSVLYPTIWDKSVLSDESSAIFAINENSFVQIIVEKNETGVDIKNWYASRFFNLAESFNMIEKNGWEGVYSNDGLALYLTDAQKSNIYTILYGAPETRPLVYINIFKMMINSFLADLSGF